MHIVRTKFWAGNTWGDLSLRTEGPQDPAPVIIPRFVMLYEIFCISKVRDVLVYFLVGKKGGGGMGQGGKSFFFLLQVFHLLFAMI